MPSPRLIVVTGANRGIGLAICRQILARPHASPVKLFAASRGGIDLALGQINNNNHNNPQLEVFYPSLDIARPDSVRALRDQILRQHGDHVSVLVNNAGIRLDDDVEYGPEEGAKRTLDVNYRGTLNMCQTFLPHLAKGGGRIVNLSSVVSGLNFYSPAIQQRFRDPAATLDDLERLAQDYEASVRNRSEQASGFGEPPRAYAFSKALVRALTRILARSQNQNQNASSSSSGILINSCCPGWIATEMGARVGHGKAPKTAEEGARIPVRLALDELDGVSGEYWANDSLRSKEAGKVQAEW